MKSQYLFDENSKHIIRAIQIVVTLMCFNAVYILLRDHLGFPAVNFLYLKDDRFADLLKYGLSAKNFFLDFDKNEYFDGLSGIFRRYYLDNPYQGPEGVGVTPHTHFMHVPLYLFITVMFSKLLTVGISPEGVIFLYFLFNSIIFLYFFNFFYTNKITLMMIFFLFTFNYPSLLVYTRGNVSGITSLVYLIFIMSLFRFQGTMVSASLLFSALLPFRVTSGMFLLLFLKTKNASFLSSVRNVSKVLLFVALFIVLSFTIAHYVYPEFTINNYLIASKTMTSYLIAPMATPGYLMPETLFSPCDASLLALLKNFGILNIYTVIKAYIVVLFFLSLAAAYIFLKSDSFTESSYVIIVMYFLLGPISIYYHLSLFVLPIATSYYESKSINVSLVAFCCALVLSPWTYIIGDINIQPFVIHFILIFSILYLSCSKSKWCNFRLCLNARR